MFLLWSTVRSLYIWKPVSGNGEMAQWQKGRLTTRMTRSLTQKFCKCFIPNFQETPAVTLKVVLVTVISLKLTLFGEWKQHLNQCICYSWWVCQSTHTQKYNLLHQTVNHSQIQHTHIYVHLCWYLHHTYLCIVESLCFDKYI